MDFQLRLEQTYWAQGFFNVTVQWANQVRASNGPVTLILGINGPQVRGRVNRDANLNRTPRVFGNKPLREWFQQYSVQSTVTIRFISPKEIHLYGPSEIGNSQLGVGLLKPEIDRPKNIPGTTNQDCQNTLEHVESIKKFVLVGCVKTKNRVPMAARDIYRSTLFVARRRWAEASSSRWFILSAKYGLLDPDQTISPYEETLDTKKKWERRDWAKRVAFGLADTLGNLQGLEIEIHAGGNYYQELEPILHSLGSRVAVPLRSIVGIGRQVAWYRERLQSSD